MTAPKAEQPKKKTGRREGQLTLPLPFSRIRGQNNGSGRPTLSIGLPYEIVEKTLFATEKTPIKLEMMGKGELRVRIAEGAELLAALEEDNASEIVDTP